MQPRLVQIPQIVWSATLLVGGCQFGGSGPAYQDDPLVLSKRVVLGKIVQSAATVQVAQAEPATPLLPPMAYAMLGPLPRHALPADVAENPREIPPRREAPRTARLPVPALPAVRQKDTAETPATTAVRRRALTTYAHAPDFSWLQGVLEQGGDGRLRLRYNEPGQEPKEPVLLVPDAEASLTTLRPGDVVVVAGEFLPSPVGQPPRYRVRGVGLAERPR